ncbi:hypothetical protein [Roseimaritima ulvae]|uniref:Uncharacterized protein n=1 Tax=Roseimaritima ulvae TaxID=980254 RepID=A0A5B9R9Y3_9BACT|nr:hypothetical protein [Roseimaritima ulvae]QEG43861.1 hypothetical protein UC8_59180 [Roseimaritima ulvae]
MATKTNNRRSRRNLLVGVVAAVILFICVGLATLAQGKVRGTEFSPQDFSEREFVFWEIPLVHLQITPIRRSGTINPLTSYLKAQQLIQVPPGGSKPSAQTWHLVKLSRGSLPRPPADAEILVNYLEGDVGARWRQWTIDHPEMAKIFWPLTQKLAKRELYVLMSDLFAITEQADTPAELRQRTGRYLQETYLQIARDLVAAEKPQIAAELLDEAIADFPTNEALQQLRDSIPVDPPATSP